MIKKFLISLGTMISIVCVLMIISFCMKARKQTDTSIVNVEESSDYINIYMFSDVVINGETGEKLNPSCYTLGEFTERSQIWGNEGHLYYSAIEEFKKNTSLEVRVSYFGTTYEILEQLKEDAKQNKLPDVIVGSYTSEKYNLIPFLLNDWFYDLTPFFEEDEIISGGNYVSKVIEAGNINGRQVLFPLTFNMNILMSSKEVLKEHNFPILKDYSYDEIVNVFIEEWSNSKRENDEMPLIQFTDMWNTYPYSLFDAASGVTYLDLETQRVTLDKKYFFQLAKIYEAYLCNDFNMSQKELKESAVRNNQELSYKHSKYEKMIGLVTEEILDGFDYIHDHAIYISDGGMQGFSLHSFAAQANYYESRFKEKNEEFLCIGIPMKESQNEYTAVVTTFGAVLNHSQHAKEGYNFLKHLADSAHFMYMDLSVNKEQIMETFSEFTNTQFEFYPAQGQFPPDDVPEGQDWLGESYTIQPMSEQTSLYLQNMIDKVGIAILPQAIPQQMVQNEIARYIYGDIDSMENAYQNAIDSLERVFE